jgi:hypothetical protein
MQSSKEIEANQRLVDGFKNPETKRLTLEVLEKLKTVVLEAS